MRKINHKILIWIGLILFVIGFISEENTIRWLHHLILIGPIIFAIGVILWIPKRLSKPILRPYSPEEYKSHADAAMAFFMNNFLLEFWVFCCGFGMILTLLGGWLMRQSAGYQAAVDLVYKDQRIQTDFGEITDIGYLIVGESSTNGAAIYLNVFASKRNGQINIEVKKEKGNWKIEKINY